MMNNYNLSLIHFNNKLAKTGLYLISIVLLVIFSVTAFQPGSVSALSGSEFQAGRIIDNSVFFDTSTMSTSQIQEFLNSKVPVCDTNGELPIYGTTRALYGASVGHPAPYTCLKDYTETIPTIINGGSDLCTNSILGGTKSAAVIIYDAAHACGINPQTLLVLLQKEQSLVTDDWPWDTQYRSATGYGCPDTAPCDEEYYGFFNQVYQAAKAFRRYEANPDSYNYKANRNNTVYYHPSLSACGSSNVFIENQATANLYIYTPYQPNQAALDNLYGTGDSCSAYGNRNFWRLFNDWFGSTLGGAYKAQYFRQGSHPSMFPGDSSVSFIDYKNIGISTWYDTVSAAGGQKPVNLAASQPINRASQFGSVWPNSSRPATQFSKVFESDGTTLAPNQHLAEPGQIVRYQFTFKASSNASPGIYREWFQPILEGSSNWNIGGLAWLQATIVNPIYSATYHSQSGYPAMTKNDIKGGFIKYRNTGNQNWYHPWSAPQGVHPVTLATTNSINRRSTFGTAWGNGGNRPDVRFEVYESNGNTIAANQNFVKPGQIAKFEILFTASSDLEYGQYREWFQPILEGSSSWNFGGRAWLQVTVVETEQKAAFHSQCGYPVIARGSSAACYLQYKNVGTNEWYHPWSAPSGTNPLTLATTEQINRSSGFGSSWGPGKNRPAVRFSKVYESDGITLTNNQNIVRPGQIAHYDFTFNVPTNTSPGVYREWFQPILEGASNWSVGGRAWLQVTVQ